ncbi:MAG: PilZ domain-containing protein [Candidatus Omnitrophica bacterium]|nr:PilZ domain-containing protein [Candidatus Omnitrophota bacterium]MCM8826780.1 PilZ domain-containing protein [Candidatus Omnitrophota bacterium]
MERLKYLEQEKWKYPRVNASLNVDYTLRGDEVREGKAVTENISTRGVCLLVYERIEIGKELDLKIYLPDEKNPLETKGKIVWQAKAPLNINSNRLGIEFVEINDRDRERIVRYLCSLCKEVCAS